MLPLSEGLFVTLSSFDQLIKFGLHGVYLLQPLFAHLKCFNEFRQFLILSLQPLRDLIRPVFVQRPRTKTSAADHSTSSRFVGIIGAIGHELLDTPGLLTNSQAHFVQINSSFI